MNATETSSPVIVCAANNRYAMPLAVVLRSLSDHLESCPRATVFVLDGGISVWNRRRVLESIRLPNLSVHWLRPPVRKLKGVPVFGHTSLCTYYRLLLPELLPPSVAKVIYLDGDVVVTGDVGALWREPVGDCPLMAVEEPNGASMAARAHRAALGMRPDSRYFNAGVLLINLNAWRREGVGAKTIDFLRRNRPVIRWWDQDGLNATLECRWGELDPRWNCRVDAGEEGGAINGDVRTAAIVHFASAVKPWDYYARHPDRQIFFDYLDRTRWAGWRPRKPWRATVLNKHWYGMWVRRVPVFGRAWSALAARRAGGR